MKRIVRAGRVVLAMVIGAITLAATAAAQQPAARTGDAAIDQWLQQNTNEHGQQCTERARKRRGDRIWIACGRAGVWELLDSAAGVRFVRSYQFDGEAIGFFDEAHGRTWVKIQSLRAQPLDSVAAPGATAPVLPAPRATTPSPVEEPMPPPPPAVAAPPPPPIASTAEPAELRPVAPPARRRFGKVVKLGEGEVVVSLGANDGIIPGMRIELSVERREELGGGQSAISKDPIAVGVVTSVTEGYSRLQLGFNENVPLGAIAERTASAPTSSLAAPPRVADLWQVQFMARPFIAMEEFGGGILASGSIGRRFDGNLHLAAELDPLALADAQDTDEPFDEPRNGVVAWSVAVLASYDSKFLEMGIGLGGQTVNSPSIFVNPGSGLSVLQLVRLGALDGLNLTARSSIALFHSEFSFGSLVVTGQIPVSRRYWLLLGGGGGDVGYAYGELGLRALLRGNGGAGSMFLNATAGGAAVFKDGSCNEFFECTEGNEYVGPMAGIGAEWRF